MKKKWLLTLAAVFVMGLSLSEPVQEFLGTEIVAEAAVTLKTPYADKKSGTYTTENSIKVSLSCSTKDADIYYSLNGGSYKRYTKSISIEKNTTLKAYSKKSGIKSKTVSYTYKLSPKFSLSKEGGNYDKAQTIKLSTDLSGVKFYYTLDGSKPSASSKKYTDSGIRISETSKLRIIACKRGWTSKYITESYTIAAASDSSESILGDYTKKYIYSTLSDKHKRLYKVLFEGISDFKKEIDVSGFNATEDDIMKVFTAIDYENPQLIWISSGYGYQYSYIGDIVQSVKPYYTRTKAEAEKTMPKLKKAAQKIIDKALSYDKLFDRVVCIHDTLIDNTVYTLNGNATICCADGPILNGKALCEGYSKAFAYLCQSIGLDTICVFGYTDQNHLWNMIKLDGNWYNVDVTYDDPTGSTPLCLHNYFCVTTKKLSKDHKPDNIFTIPKATSTDYDYYKYMGITVYYDKNTALAALYKGFAENHKKGIMRTEIICDPSIILDIYNDMSKNAITGLKKYGCNPGEIWIGCSGNTVYIQK